MARTADKDDDAMRRVRKVWAKLQDDGWTQQKLGEAMGYAPTSARKSVSQFLKSHDPAVSMLRRFAKAAGVPLGQLLGDSP